MLADHTRAMLVVEKKGSGPGGVNLYQSYGQSSCMNATVTVALEQDQSLQPRARQATTTW